MDDVKIIMDFHCHHKTMTRENIFMVRMRASENEMFKFVPLSGNSFMCINWYGKSRDMVYLVRIFFWDSTVCVYAAAYND